MNKNIPKNRQVLRAKSSDLHDLGQLKAMPPDSSQCYQVPTPIAKKNSNCTILAA